MIQLTMLSVMNELCCCFMQLFVKNIPYGKSLENVKELFSKYGKVYEVVPDPSRQHVFFLVRETIFARNA